MCPFCFEVHRQSKSQSGSFWLPYFSLQHGRDTVVARPREPIGPSRTLKAKLHISQQRPREGDEMGTVFLYATLFLYSIQLLAR
eukprot:3811069-Pyramimonas_sp.AAC.1